MWSQEPSTPTLFLLLAHLSAVRPCPYKAARMGQSGKGSLTVDSRGWLPQKHRGAVDTLISGVGGLSRLGKKLNVRGISGRQRGAVEGFLCLDH